MAARARSGISCARFLAMLADGRSPTATRMCIYGRRRRGRSVRCTDQTLRSPRYSVTSVSQPPTRWHAVASARCTLSRPTGCSQPEDGREATLLAGFAHAQSHLASEAGITKRIGWHTFRRSLATLLIDVGALVKLTQEIMRHADSRVTIELYQ